MKKIRVMVVDDHPVVRQGYSFFLKAYDDFELVAEATNGQEAVDFHQQFKPDVTLMDIVMPEMNGVTAIQRIRAVDQAAHIIALTSYTEDPQNIEAALKSGAIGYLFKDISIEELAHAIRTAHAGIQVFAPEVTQMLIQARTQPSATHFNLSEREREVLQELVEGLTNQQIANRLFISRSTVNFHVSSILSKMAASSRTEAVSLAHQHHLVKRPGETPPNY